MKLATITHDGRTKAALVDSQAEVVWPLEDMLGRPVPDLTAIVAELDAIRPRLKPTGAGIPLAMVKVEAPIPRPARNIMCVGKNYHEHAREFTKSGFDSSASSVADAIPTAPIIFTKVPECVIANGADIRYPAGVSDSLDYEAELGLVIGRGGRAISKAQAYSHVCGYTIINDVTARDLQGKHKQWFLAKSLDTFCPMGPWLVTADEVDPANLGVKCWVNDELRQNANTRDLIFDIPTLIATISAGITLLPGDVIATGTPAGVGIGFTPPRFLQRGDRVTIEIEGLGRLSNSVA